MQQAVRGKKANVQRVSGPVRTRVPAPEETGGHELMLSDGTIWCNECGLYTRQRQSRQFGVECTQVVRPSREALRAGRHPIRGYKFRETRKVTAEIFAFAAHSPNCIRQQESRRILFWVWQYVMLMLPVRYHGLSACNGRFPRPGFLLITRVQHCIVF